MSKTELSRLLGLIEKELNWGEATDWKNRDFERLNILILEKTKISLSSSTLRRIWGKVDYSYQPSLTTLDALSSFAGFASWREFCRQPEFTGLKATGLQPSGISGIRYGTFYIFAAVALILLTTAILIYEKISRETLNPSDQRKYAFTSKAVTRDIPNSVVFNYEAGTAGTSPVIIQQSWDRRRRTVVPTDKRQFTSIYYRPGFYQAKLLVGGRIVREHPLLIPTKGWLALLAKEPVPVYLDDSEFVYRDHLGISGAKLQKKLFAEKLESPVSEYYNVGNFAPVGINDFSFSVTLKNTFSEGVSKCALVNIQLITDNQPLNIPLSMPGCISNLTLSNGQDDISGRSNDLSVFGVNVARWTKISCKSNKDSIYYFIDEKLVYRTLLPKKKLKILGLALTFQGGGSIRAVRLLSGQQTVFSAF